MPAVAGKASQAWLQSAVECLVVAPDPGCAPADGENIPGGSSGGRMPPTWASGGQRPLAAASVRAGHGLYGGYSDALVVHGKEEVYGPTSAALRLMRG